VKWSRIGKFHLVGRRSSTAHTADGFLQLPIADSYSLEFGCNLTVMPVNGHSAACDLPITWQSAKALSSRAPKRCMECESSLPQPESHRQQTNRPPLCSQSTDDRQCERKETDAGHKHFLFAQTPDDKIAIERFPSNGENGTQEDQRRSILFTNSLSDSPCKAVGQKVERSLHKTDKQSQIL
jgi:hypothetical protein